MTQVSRYDIRNLRKLVTCTSSCNFYFNMLTMDFEPMDVDKSASSTSKMDISFNDTGSDVFILDDDENPNGSNFTVKVKKEVPDVENDDIIFHTSKNITLEAKQENPKSLQSYLPYKNEVFESLKEAETNKDETVVRPKSLLKTYHIKMEHLQKKDPFSKLTYFLLGGLILILSVVIYQATFFRCAEEIDLRSIRKSFTENLFGQPAAANKIIEALNVKDKSKLILLYGGTGVGKTYAVSLILNQLWSSANVYHYTMPTFADTFSPELMLGLTLCKTSILVVEDLTNNDMDITLHIKNVLAKSKNLGKNITIFLVYNCDNVTDNFVKKCDDDTFQNKLERSFGHIDIEKYFILFQPLNQEHLKKCVERELGNTQMNEEEINNILKNFDVVLDGCKGVNTKIKLLNVVGGRSFLIS